MPRRTLHLQLMPSYFRLGTSYKNIDRVMKAQKDLVKVKRRLSPLLSYKGG